MDRFLTLGFSRPKHSWLPLSFIIRKVQNTTYSHVYVVMDSQYLERKIVFQASGFVVNFSSYKRLQEHNEIIKEYKIPITKNTQKQVLQFAFDKAGAPYGMRQILGMGWALLLERLTGKRRNPLDDDGRSYVCSEIVAEILKDYVGLAVNIDTDVITPKDVFAIVSVIGTPSLIK